MSSNEEGVSDLVFLIHVFPVFSVYVIQVL